MTIDESKIKEPWFWAKTKLNPLTNCLEWTGAKDNCGYGRIVRFGFEFKSHRWLWEMINGAIKNDLCILHKCDNPCCVNIEHLFIGTHSTNMFDMAVKGRAKPSGVGELHPLSVLTDQNIKEIRALYPNLNAKNLALIFKTSKGYIFRIVYNKVWKHVQPSEQEILDIKTKYATQYT